MEKKSNKGLIITIVILTILLLGTIGYICYDKLYLNNENKPAKESQETINKENEEQTSKFYDIDELVKNNYIRKITKSQGEEYIKITDGKVYVKLPDGIVEENKNNFVEAKGIDGTPKYVYGTYRCMDCKNYTYTVITVEGDVYYSGLEPMENSNGSIEMPTTVPKFQKVNQEPVVNVYSLVELENLIGTPYYETKEKKLISVVDGKTTFEENWKYPDQLHMLLSWDLRDIYISSDKKIYNWTDQNYSEILYNENSILAKDIFWKYKENENRNVLQSFVMSQDKKIYIIENTKTGEYGKITKVDLYNNKEVKEYKANKIDSESNYFKVEIEYTDGTTETLNNVRTSTLYYRNK